MSWNFHYQMITQTVSAEWHSALMKDFILWFLFYAGVSSWISCTSGSWQLFHNSLTFCFASKIVVRVCWLSQEEKRNMFCLMSVLFKASVLLKHACHHKPLVSAASYSRWTLSWTQTPRSQGLHAIFVCYQENETLVTCMTVEKSTGKCPKKIKSNGK